MANSINVSKTTLSTLTDAVRRDVTAGNRWKDAGDAVRAEFGTREKAEAARDVLLAAIYAGMPTDQAKAAQADIPRKNGEAWAKASESQRASWEILKAAKKDASATAHTFMARVLKYAFPKMETETDTEGETEATNAADTRTKLLKAASAILSKMQNDEAPAYRIADAVKACNALIAALSVESGIDKANNAQAGSSQRRTK